MVGLAIELSKNAQGLTGMGMARTKNKQSPGIERLKFARTMEQAFRVLDSGSSRILRREPS